MKKILIYKILEETYKMEQKKILNMHRRKINRKK